MSYKALYRRFRPETFDNLVGQENVVTILKNQVKTNNIGHAYLFSGIRGTGKTSAAKIFARAVNCLNPKDGNPCNECEICTGILEENIMDVVELDAASNNKVEDIRELKENSNYPPSKARYKVYIVDEVHMLSKGAFNAFLKTLEEPPSYVIFILATTEEQRLPATILSRCQRYEFKRIPNDIIAENLLRVCEEIGVKAEQKAISLIARNSEGAMRDALSILDQCLSNVEEFLSEEDVIETIGLVDTSFLADISDYIIEKDTVSVVGMFDDLMKSGKDLKVFLKELIVYFRNLMIVKSGSNYNEYIDLAEESIFNMEELAKKLTMSEIVNYLEMLNESEQKMKISTQPRTIVELTLIKMSEQDSFKDLMARIEKLEKIISSGEILKMDLPGEKRVDTKTNAKKDNSYDSKKENIQISHNIEIKTKTSLEENTKSKAKIDKEVTREQSLNDDLTFDDILKEWDSCMEGLRKSKPASHALIMEGNPINYTNGQITVSFGPMFGFHKEAVERPDNKEYIENFISNYLKSDTKIKTVMDGEEQAILKNDIIDDDEKDIEDVIEFFGKDKVTIE